LETSGYIRGYHAEVAARELGYKEMFFALVGLDSQAQEVLSGFEQAMADWAEIRECHMIRGGGDFLLRLVARDTAHENQLTQRLTGGPHVSRVQTLQTIRTSRSLAGVPL
jgi:DNA-binding Lrp family transcriptional regulator